MKNDEIHWKSSERRNTWKILGKKVVQKTVRATHVLPTHLIFLFHPVWFTDTDCKSEWCFHAFDRLSGIHSIDCLIGWNLKFEIWNLKFSMAFPILFLNNTSFSLNVFLRNFAVLFWLLHRRTALLTWSSNLILDQDRFPQKQKGKTHQTRTQKLKIKFKGKSSTKDQTAQLEGELKCNGAIPIRNSANWSSPGNKTPAFQVVSSRDFQDTGSAFLRRTSTFGPAIVTCEYREKITHIKCNTLYTLHFYLSKNPVNQSTDQSLDQSIKRTINQASKQSIHWRFVHQSIER